jgi:hypothetical protein
MKGLKIFFFVTVSCFIAAPLYADIYEWTDENGVRHFTNYTPPATANILIKTEEVPYDEAADRERIEAERQLQLELDRLEIAEKEAEIERLAAEAERKAAEADRYSEEIRRQADKYLQEAKIDRHYYRSYGYFGYYRPPHYHFKPNKRRYFKRNYYGHSGTNLHYKYRQKERFSRKAIETKRPLKYRGKNRYRSSRIGWRGKGYHGIEYLRGGRAGFK